MERSKSYDKKMEYWEEAENELAPILLKFIIDKNVPPLVISGAYKKIASGAWSRWLASKNED